MRRAVRRPWPPCPLRHGSSSSSWAASSCTTTRCCTRSACNESQPERRFNWHVYIVRCADRTLYTGVAKDLPARIAAHNGGRGAKYTRQRLPVKLVYAEPALDRG